MNKNKIKKKFISDGLGWDAEPAFSNNLCKNLELFYFPGHLYYNNIELNVEYVVYLKNDRFSGYNMIIEDKGQVDDMNKLFEFLINRFDCKEIEQKSNNKLYILNNDNFKNSIYGTYKDGLKRISISIINKHEMPIECLKPED